MKKVLIVDDEPFVLAFFGKMIQKHNHYLSLNAKHGLEALSMLKNEVVDLIILDINMPIMDGLETLENIRHNDSIKNLPVIVISAMFADEVKQKFKELGVNDFVSKLDMVDKNKGQKIFINTLEKYLEN